ncbi:unnamed protein product [Polarella glacialis]|uniref:Uncharacterized protein n=1 Tax=Polarella glacialis TaxID=89957 RepID=A0A813KAV2_POLGL|nr:unnamed protein product [Polarella glacialis]
MALRCSNSSTPRRSHCTTTDEGRRSQTQLLQASFADPAPMLQLLSKQLQQQQLQRPQQPQQQQQQQQQQPNLAQQLQQQRQRQHVRQRPSSATQLRSSQSATQVSVATPWQDRRGAVLRSGSATRSASKAHCFERVPLAQTHVNLQDLRAMTPVKTPTLAQRHQDGR